MASFKSFESGLLKALETKFKGTDSAETIVYKKRDLEFASTGSAILDEVVNPELGAMGLLVKRRITEVFGMESCIYEESEIEYIAPVKNEEDNFLYETRGGTIKKLYKAYHDNQDSNKYFKVPSVEESTGIVFYQKVLDVVKSGKKDCYLVEFESGQSLTTTKEHRYRVGRGDYKKLKNLKIGDEAYVAGETGSTALKSKITKIEYQGLYETYDIKCAYPNNNFISQGVVVHNSGKSTVAYQSAKEAIDKGWVGALLDVEGSWDKKYGEALGLVEGESFRVFQPVTGEDAETLINSLFGLGKGNKKTAIDLDFVIIDSVTALTTLDLLESEDSTGKGSSKGSHARFWNNLVKKLNKVAIQKDVAWLLINQVRDVISMANMYQEKSLSNDNMLGSGFNSDNTKATTGGRGIKFYASLRVMLQQTRRAKTLVKKHGKDVEVKNKINYIRADVVKNKLSVPFGRANLAIVYGRGFDDRLPMFDYLKEHKVIQAVGTSGVYKFEFEGETYLEVKGLPNFQKELFKKHRKNLKEVYLKMRKKEFKDTYMIEDEDILEEMLDGEVVEVLDDVEVEESKPKKTKAKKKK
jgi:recombination protein RecA